MALATREQLYKLACGAAMELAAVEDPAERQILREMFDGWLDIELHAAELTREQHRARMQVLGDSLLAPTVGLRLLRSER